MVRSAMPSFERTLAPGVRLSVDGRTARWAPGAASVELLVAAGPAPGALPPGEAQVALPPPAAPGPEGAAASGGSPPRRPRLVVLLGGLGETEAEARRTLLALARADPDAPVLVVPGGRDRRPVLEAVLDPLVGGRRAGDDGAAGGRVSPILDGTRLDAVRVGPADELVLVAGAPEGRYAVGPSACGYGAEDLERLRRRLGPASPSSSGRRRWLLAWAAPARAGVRSRDGADAGDPALAELVTTLGIAGGVHAWPTLSARRGRSGGVALGQLGVPRFTGPAVRRGDDALVGPGWTRIVFRPGEPPRGEALAAP